MRRKGYLGAAWLGLLTLSAIACAGRTTDLTAVGNDSESHFLVHCQPGGCGEGLSCLFGVCTARCNDDAECSAWSTGAACLRGGDAAATGAEQSVCDVACNEAADCLALGPHFTCDEGACRADSLQLTSSNLWRACTVDAECGTGLRCEDNACSRPCEVAADCGFPGATCPRFTLQDGTITPGRCVYNCGSPEDPSAHEQCAFLGEGGRCIGTCIETLAGQCGDVGQPDAEWSCYEDVAADVFRARHDRLLDEELCLGTSDGRVYDIEYRLCPDSTCAGGGGGCRVSGLVLESEPAQLESPNTLVAPLVSARAEVRTRDSFRMQFDLLDPIERCEYVVDARFWSLQLFDGYSYLSPYIAELRSLETPPSSGLLTEAIEGGFWQVAHTALLGHDEHGSPGVIIEDSEAQVQLTSGGVRCGEIQEHVGIVARDILTDAINSALQRWGESVDDTLECTQCGQLGCELACRPR